MKKQLPSIEELDRIFTYDHETGSLIRIASCAKRFIGKEAGCIMRQLGRDTCRSVSIDDIPYMAHRIIWKMVTRKEPPIGSHIDHIDGNPLNNKWSNLRIATSAENGRNRKMKSTSVTRIKGVSAPKRREKSKKPYMAHITVNGKCQHLGVYYTKGEAGAAYAKAAIRLHGEFARYR